MHDIALRSGNGKSIWATLEFGYTILSFIALNIRAYVHFGFAVFFLIKFLFRFFLRKTIFFRLNKLSLKCFFAVCKSNTNSNLNMKIRS